MKTTKRNIDLISGFLKNELSENDRKELFHWVRQKPENRKYFDQLRDIWDAAHLKEYKNIYNRKEGWNSLHELIRQDERIARQKTFRIIRNVFRYAAVVIVTIASVYFFVSRNPQLVFSENLNQISVPFGEKTSVFLSDSTKVTLNAGSTLSYDNSFDYRNRKVYLRGEAFFEVSKNSSKPFIVNVDGLNVQVLGTKFNVKAYPDEHLVETILIEGSVQLEIEESNKLLVMRPNEYVVYNKNTRQLTSSFEDPVELQVLWKDDVLAFRNKSLEMIARELERSYDRKIVFVDETLKNFHYSGKFITDDINEVLTTISKLSPMTYEIKNDSIFLINTAN
ncbi:MAG: DUF4974 domain-containing protein [Bacteroidales bacterium]|nr:DUF4974 domain-containing protein [Bacteroidales bacterium]